MSKTKRQEDFSSSLENAEEMDTRQVKKMKAEDTPEISTLENFLFGELAKKKSDLESSDEEDESPENSSAPAWVDEDDEEVTINIAKQLQLRKLRKDLSEKSITGTEYQNRLREQFNKKNGTASWAVKAREEASAQKKEIQEDEDSDATDYEDDNDVDDAKQRLLRNARALVVDKSSGLGPLPEKTIDIIRTTDLNFNNSTKGKIMAMEFSSQSNVAFVLGVDRMLRIFNIEPSEHTHSKEKITEIKKLNFEKNVIRHACFNSTGTEIWIICDFNNQIFIYNIEKARLDVMSTINTSNPNKKSRFLHISNSKVITYSHPDSKEKNLFLLYTNDGIVFTVNEVTKACINTIHINNELIGATLIKNKKILIVMDVQSFVYFYDLNTNRCIQKEQLIDCYKPLCFNVTSNTNKYSNLIQQQEILQQHNILLVGCVSGHVNMYELHLEEKSQMISKTPYSIMENLTTPITSISVHPSCELAVIASNEANDALRLYHLNSKTTFQNWPTQKTPLNKVTVTAFSADGKYMAVANVKGDVRLFQLNHFVQKMKNVNL